MLWDNIRVRKPAHALLQGDDMDREQSRFTILARTDEGLDAVLKAFLQPYPHLHGLTAHAIRDCFTRRQEGSQALMDLDPERQYITLTMNMDVSWAVSGLRMIIAPEGQKPLGDWLTITPHWWFPERSHLPAWRVAWQANDADDGQADFAALAPTIEGYHEPFEHYAVLADYGFDSL